jgi:CheY-like chemotaxis protein
MSVMVNVALVGFSAFERSAMASYFRLAVNRQPRYKLVEGLDEALLVIVDGDSGPALKRLYVAKRGAQALAIGGMRPPGVAMHQKRPIDPLHVLRDLDALSAAILAGDRGFDTTEPAAFRALMEPLPVPEAVEWTQALDGGADAARPGGLDIDLEELQTEAGALDALETASDDWMRQPADEPAERAVPAPAAAPKARAQPPADAAVPVLRQEWRPLGQGSAALPLVQFKAPQPFPPGSTAMPAKPTVAAPAGTGSGRPRRRRRGNEAGLKAVGRHALLVDSDEVAALAFESQLSRFGLHTAVAHSADAALREAVEGGFDFVFVELALDGRDDGIDLCRQFKQRARPAGEVGPLLVLLTSGATQTQRVRATMAGVDAFLARPVVESALHGLLAAHGLKPLSA